MENITKNSEKEVLLLLKAEIKQEKSPNLTSKNKGEAEIDAICEAFTKFVKDNKYTVTRHPAGAGTKVYYLTKEKVVLDQYIVKDYKEIALILANPQSLDNIVIKRD